MRRCWFKVIAATAVAFIAVAGAAENLEKYLYLPGAIWILGGTFIVFLWSIAMFCFEHED